MLNPVVYCWTYLNGALGIWVKVSTCMTGRVFAILARAKQARLGENSRNEILVLCLHILLRRELLA